MQVELGKELESLCNHFFDNLKEHDDADASVSSSSATDVVATIRRATATSTVESGAQTYELSGLRLTPEFWDLWSRCCATHPDGSPRLPCNLESVLAQFNKPTDEVLQSPVIAFAFLEAVRRRCLPDATVSMNGNDADDESSEEVCFSRTIQ